MNDKKIDVSDTKATEGITIDVSDIKPGTSEKEQAQAQAGPDIPVAGASLPAVIEVQTLAPTQKRIVDTIQIQPQHKQQAEQVAVAHNFLDTNAALTFGAGPQRKYLDNLKLLLAMPESGTFRVAEASSLRSKRVSIWPVSKI